MVVEEHYKTGYAKGLEDAGKKTFDENQINGRIIGSHGTFSPEFDYVFLGYRKKEDGSYAKIVLVKEKKIDLHNNDLTSGFLNTDMGIWNFCNADYLSKVINMEKILGVELTRHYNRYARTATYSYALSKGNQGKASQTAKKQYLESSSFETLHQQEIPQKKGGIGSAVSGFLSGLPKTKEPIKP